MHFDKVTCKGCTRGEQMCIRPCWGTPADIEKLINEGYAGSLMLDWFIGGIMDRGKEKVISVLCPASHGAEGKVISLLFYVKAITEDIDISRGPICNGCVMQENKLCKLHDMGLKPSMGAASCCKDSREKTEQLQQTIGRSWDTEEGRQLIERWKKIIYDTQIQLQSKGSQHS